MPGGPMAPAGKRYRFDHTDQIVFEGRDYIYVRANPSGHTMRLKNGKVEEHVSHEEMRAIVRSPGYRHDRHFYSYGRTYARIRSGVDSINDVPADERATVMWKYEFVTRFLRLEMERRKEVGTKRGKKLRSDDPMKAAIAKIQEGVRQLDCARYRPHETTALNADGTPRKTRSGTTSTVREPPTPRTLRTWLSIMSHADWNAHALREGYRFSGNYGPKLHELVHEIVHSCARGYASETRPTKKECHRRVEEAVKALNDERAKRGEPALPVPTIRPLSAVIDALPYFHVLAARHTLEHAINKCKLVSDHVEATRIGQRVECDEWEMHLQLLMAGAGIWSMLTDEQKAVVSGRWMVCVAMDVASRAILGFQIAPSATANLAVSTLAMVVSDKASAAGYFGAVTPWDMALTPEMVVTDGGSAFTSDRFVAAVTDLRSEMSVPPGGQPALRGTLERFFRTIDAMLLVIFTGRTFSNVADKGKYVAEARASLSPRDFVWALGRWIVDSYHNAPHEGLGGETPFNAFRRLESLYGLPAPPGADRLRAVFGVEFKRVTSNRGVRFLGLHFSNAIVGAAILENGLEEVTIRVSLDDIGRISIRLDDAWHEVPCRTAGFDGVSVEAWTDEASKLRAHHARSAAITRDIVNDALAAIRRRARTAEESVGIHALRPTAEVIEHSERELLRGLTIPVDIELAAEDSRAAASHTFAVTGPETQPQNDLDGHDRTDRRVGGPASNGAPDGATPDAESEADVPKPFTIEGLD